MASFVLDRWTISGGSLEARFTEGPAETPVVYVNVVELEDVSVAEEYLSGIDPFNEEVSVSEGSGAILIQGDYADPLMLKGKRVSLRKSGFEASDFERHAKVNEEWGKSMHETWRTLNARVEDAKHLLVDHRRRLLEKVTRHAADSTARQLYEQQVSFIDRVLSKLDT